MMRIEGRAAACPTPRRGSFMRTKSLASAVAGLLLVATALTPVRAADMTNERALNVQREPQNWLLHHGNYQGHRFSLLKEIDTSSVKNMRLEIGRASCRERVYRAV
jgi:glucose dehydrogenase